MRKLTMVSVGLVALFAAGGFFAWQATGTRSAVKPGYPATEGEERHGRYEGMEAFLAMWRERLDGTGELSPAQVNLRVNQQVLQRGAGASLPAWGFEELGPGNFGGRSRGLIVHPTVPGRLLFSSVSGGL
jgi:hypothetical protein